MVKINVNDTLNSRLHYSLSLMFVIENKSFSPRPASESTGYTNIYKQILFIIMKLDKIFFFMYLLRFNVMFGMSKPNILSNKSISIEFSKKVHIT